MLLDFCLSLWVAQISGLVVLETFFTIIACALEKIKDNANQIFISMMAEA